MYTIYASFLVCISRKKYYILNYIMPKILSLFPILITNSHKKLERKTSLLIAGQFTNI